MSILEEIGDRCMFVMYRVIPREDKKTDKIPTSPLTGFDVSGQNPSNWMTGWETAIWAAQWEAARPEGVLGYGVGIVLYEGCNIAALDFDGCRDSNGGWQPHVAAFCNHFPGAAFETSFSQTGAHLFVGYTGPAPAHGTRNKTYRMEAYTKARFIALTGLGASGSVLVDHTAELHRFLTEYFPEREEAEQGVEWTSRAVEAWHGPEDDAELIQRALRSHSMKAVFGRGASFSDLWYATPEVLSRVFPPQSAHQTWDGSAADQALANHLAFWTGNNCERIEHLMHLSALVRPKWERVEYIPNTILKACASQTEWYSDIRAVAERAADGEVLSAPPSHSPISSPSAPFPPPEEVGPQSLLPSLASPASSLAAGELPPPGTYVTVQMQQRVFDGMCYVQDIHQIQLSDGTALPKDRFDATYGGRQYGVTPDGQRPSKSAWDAFTINEMFDFPKVATQYFKPGESTGTIRVVEGRKEINSYRPSTVRRLEGDPSRFLNFIQRLLPNGNDAQILLCYMAACVQNLGTKFMWTVFLQGVKGNGKTTIGKILEYCLSLRYTHWARADQLGEKFNAVFVDKLLVIVDEMYSDDARELQETLKILVTGDRIEVRPMYAEKCMKEVCFNLFLMSNYKNGVRIDGNERRYAPLFCAQQTKEDLQRDGLTEEYFYSLRTWLWKQDGAAMVYDYLMSLSIPDELNPATRRMNAPITTSTALAATASLGGAEQEIIEAIRQQEDGFRDGWISSTAVDMLLARFGKGKSIPRNARRELIQSLGYLPHPSLSEGLCPVALPDGSLPRLYVVKGHSWAVDYLSAQQVRDGFVEAQKRK